MIKAIICPFITHYRTMNKGIYICSNHHSEMYDDYVLIDCLKVCHPDYEYIMRGREIFNLKKEILKREFSEEQLGLICQIDILESMHEIVNTLKK